MSRSKRKPYLKDKNRSTFFKDLGNKLIRKQKIDLVNDENTKFPPYKYLDPWNIHDWCFYYPDNKKAYRK